MMGRISIAAAVLVFAVFSIGAMVCLVVTTELNRAKIIGEASLEMITATVLFTILGMGVVLNILLLFAGYQKDIRMLRLYNNYAAVTTLAAFLPTFILLSRLHFVEVCAATFAIVMQCYVIVLVRSTVLKLELKTVRRDDQTATNTGQVDVPDRDHLI